MPNNLKIALFGTPEFAVMILEEMKRGGLVPELIVTNPDEPKGRKLLITPPPTKIWGHLQGVNFIQPENLQSIPKELQANFDLFIVAAYGKIIPDSILNLPKYGTINVHPSLLPKYRGASPVQAAILNGDAETGVSIMLLDKEMDHGPIIAQEKFDLTKERLYLPELKEKLAKVAGQMLVTIIPDWVAGKIKPTEQDHEIATFTKKIGKEDGFIESVTLLEAEINGTNAKNIDCMVRALNPDPGVFTNLNPKARGAFVSDKKIRVKITKVNIKDGKLIIEKVIPEGKKEMNWADFKRGNL